MNTKVISVGAGALVILAVLYVGNLVVNTTPAGVAKTSWEYKTVNIWPEECDNKRHECNDTVINQQSEQGWEFYSYIDDNMTAPHYALFRKPR